MAQTDSGDGESDESSEDENESEQQSSDEEEETENDSTAEEKRSEKSGKSKEKATHLTTEVWKTKSQDDESSRRVKGKKLSKAAGAPSKDDSLGDKEESDPGGSRDQEDQPKKRNRRRHREPHSQRWLLPILFTTRAKEAWFQREKEKQTWKRAQEEKL